MTRARPRPTRRSTRGHAASSGDEEKTGDAVKESARVSGGQSDDESERECCVVCETASSRVTVSCEECAAIYHLSCHRPPLRRRPAAHATWSCSQCEKDSGGVRTRVVADVEASVADGDQEVATNVRRSGRAVKQTRQEGKARVKMKTARRLTRAGTAMETNSSDDGDGDGDAWVEPVEPARKRRRGASTPEEPSTSAVPGGAKRTRRKKANVGNGAVSVGKVADEGDASDSDLAALATAVSRAKKATAVRKPLPSKNKRPARQARKAEVDIKRPRQIRSFARVDRLAAASEDDDNEDASFSGGDDDGDSDFEAGSESKQEESPSESDDFEPPAKLPFRIKSPAKKAPPKKSRARVDRKANSKDLATDENDSMALSNSNNESSSDEDDVSTGPLYFIEYAPNARAKCKSCEDKIFKDDIRVGVRLRHSMFGLTTYFKHMQCTQICLNVIPTATQETVEDESVKGESVVKSVNIEQYSKDNEPIRGLRHLKVNDQKKVMAHMEANTAGGLADERIGLSDEHYERKARMPEKDPSPHLTVPLLPYQREALAWMTNQEKSSYKGGILADEMGMGKTIQAISLILENPRGESEQSNVPMPKGKGRAKKDAATPLVRGGTLVVCPLVAVMQWKSEIERFVDRNHFSIYIHHGNKRMELAEKIATYDIVLTTYSIIESESRKTLGWEKVPCRYCKKKYLPDKLITHNKYFCGPNAKKTALQDRQQTKKKKTAAGEESESDEDLKKKPVKGKRRAKKADKKKVDSESEDDFEGGDSKPTRRAKKGKSPLHEIRWARIILDEAHYIKDRRCNTARGVFQLVSYYKWCLTGTPLQNRIGELFSLVRFLQVKRYAFYHCTKCDCQMLDHNFTDGKCDLCEHTVMSHFSFFNKKIVIPIQSYGYVAEGKLAMLRLQNEVLQHILLRRTKDGRADDISLPPKLIRIRRDRLDERENDFYQAIYTQSQAQFNTYVSSGTLLNNYAHIFDLLIRLRQAVDHPYLVIYSKSNPALQVPVDMLASDPVMRPIIKQTPLNVFQDDEEYTTSGTAIGSGDASCEICHEDAEDPVKAQCSHSFCRECVKEFIESLPEGAAAVCPSCDEALTVNLAIPQPKEPDFNSVDIDSTQEHDTNGAEDSNAVTITAARHSLAAPRHVDLTRYQKHSIMRRITDLDSFQTSTKVEALMQELEHMKARDPSGKAIIFSQFVNMLDIIQHRLTLGGVKCVKLAGNMTMDVRDRTIRAFRDDNSITAFLVSLKAGGVALNLTIASHIFLMDPWWNPAAENQAIDRTHRLGQFKPVQATRFIIAGTIEERILKLQEKKQLIFEGTVGGSVSAICRLTEEDLRFLFST